MNKPLHNQSANEPHYYLTMKDDTQGKTWVTIGNDDTKITLSYIDAYRLAKELKEHFQLYR